MGTAIRRLRDLAAQWSAGWMLRFFRRPMRFLLGMVALPLLVTMAAAYRVNVELVRAQSVHNLRVTARLGAEIVDRTLGETLRLEGVIARDPALRRAIEREDRAALADRLAELSDHLPTLRGSMLMRPNGTLLAAYPSTSEHPPSLQDAPWFQEAQQHARESSVSAVYVDRGHKVVAAVAPVFGERDELIGLLQVRYGVDDMRRWLQTIRVDPGRHPLRRRPLRPARRASLSGAARRAQAGLGLAARGAAAR
jgi:hypothetical protein